MNDRPHGFNGGETVDVVADPLAELRRVNAELVAARKAALNALEDAIQARDALRVSGERQAFLLRLSDALRPLADPAEVQATAVRLLGEHLGVDRAYYVTLNEADGWADVHREYRRGGSPSLVGRHRTADFGWVISPIRRGEALVIPDVAASPLVPPADRSAMAAVRIAAHLNAPLVKAGLPAGALCVTDDRPRAWTPAEVGLVREVAERTWAAVERAKAEAALRRSEERYRALFESHAEMVCQFRPDGTILLVNDAYARAFGTTPDRLIGTSFWDLIPAEEHAAVRARLDALTPESPLVLIENMVTTVHGPRWTLWTNRALAFDAAGRMAEAQSTGVDVTDRKRAEAALTASEQRLRGVASNLPRGAVFVVDHDLRYLLAAGEALGSAGYSSAAVEGKTVAEVLPPELAERHAANFRRALAGEAFRTEDAKHGRHYITHGTPLRDAEGRVTAALAVSYDITDRVLAEAALRAGEERLRLIVESATDYAIFTLAPDRTVTSWAPGATAVFGYTEAEMVDRSGDILFTTEDRAAGVPEREAGTARRDGRAADERWHLRKDGSRFFASGVLHRLQDGGGFVKVARDLTRRKLAEEELERRVTDRTADLATAVGALEAEMGRRRELARRLTTAQEDERRRIARDLHDSLGQYLAAMSLELTAAHGAAPQPDIRDRLGRLTELAAETGREVHRLALELRPTALDDLGLGVALQNYVEAWSARTGIAAEFGGHGLGGRRFPWQVSTAVYRVVQEALTNVARHARASRVSVLVERQPDHLSVVVEDDGIGFDPDRALARPPARGGLGLLGMRERVALVDGTIQIESATGSGTAVFVRIPLPAHEGGSHG